LHKIKGLSLRLFLLQKPRLGFEPRTFALPRRRFGRLLQRSNQAELPRHDELAQLDNLLTLLECLLNFVQLFLQLFVKFLHCLLVLWHVYLVDHLAVAFALTEYYFSIHELFDITFMGVMLKVRTDCLSSPNTQGMEEKYH